MLRETLETKVLYPDYIKNLSLDKKTIFKWTKTHFFKEALLMAYKQGEMLTVFHWGNTDSN